jgi:hypothetical protein
VIVRVPHKRDYTVLKNRALRDKRISFRATGILAFLLSLPDGSEVTGEMLWRVKAEGRDACYKAMKELEDAGYLVRQVETLGDKKLRTTVTVYEVPKGEHSVPENPQTLGSGFSVTELTSGNRVKPQVDSVTGKPIPENPESKEEVLEASTEVPPPPGNRKRPPPTPSASVASEWVPTTFEPPTPEEKAALLTKIGHRKNPT